MIETARYLTIILDDDTDTSFNTKSDWGLYIQNFDCIGEPILQTNYIEVPGSNKKIDASQAISGRPTYTSREIKVDLAGNKTKTAWPAFISVIRNAIEGKVCRVIFSDDSNYFWKGRIQISSVVNELSIGRFTLSIPECEPYKYDILQSDEDAWIWDTFNFETGVIDDTKEITVNGSKTVTYPKGHMLTVPNILVSNSSNLKVKYKDYTINLYNGTNKDPRILLNGDEVISLKFTGQGKVSVIYRGGSL